MIEKSLGDIIEIKHGYAFDGEHIVSEDNGIVLVTPGNFKIGGGFKEEKCKFFNGQIPDNYVLHGGDYIVTMTDLSKTIDTLGYSAKIPANSKRLYLHNQRIGLISFKDEDVCKDYIYYVMQTNDYQRSIANTSTGATVHHTSPTKICDYKFFLPEYKVQKKVAEILASFDSLIENNQKQIKLLEEAAQRLYKEWFVDLRFPGYEDVEIVGEIPIRWEKKKVGDFINTTSGGTPSRTRPDYYENGTNLWVKTKELNDGFIFDTEEKITDIAINKSSAKIIPARSILLAMYGATIGRLGIACEELTCNQACCVFLFDDEEWKREYLYCWLVDNRSFLISQGKGAAQENLSQANIKQFDFMIPNEELIKIFSMRCKTIFQKKCNLELQIQKIQEVRDRLLPKLMSGEIEV